MLLFKHAFCSRLSVYCSRIGGLIKWRAVFFEFGEEKKKRALISRHIVAHFFPRFRNFSCPSPQNRPQNFVEIVPRVVIERPGTMDCRR